MNEYLPLKQDALNILYQLEAPPERRNCSCGKPGLYRCRDCQYDTLYCIGCCLKAHLALWYHRVAVYDGNRFTSVSLHSLGLIRYLGHHGRSCQQGDTGVWMTVDGEDDEGVAGKRIEEELTLSKPRNAKGARSLDAKK